MRNELAFADRQAQSDGVTPRGSEGKFHSFSRGLNHACGEGARGGLLLSNTLIRASMSAPTHDFICCPQFTSHTKSFGLSSAFLLIERYGAFVAHTGKHMAEPN